MSHHCCYQTLINRATRAAGVALVLLLTLRCNGKLAAPQSAAPLPPAAVAPPTAVGTVPSLRIVVFPDHTRSMGMARVARVSADDFAPVYDRLAASGGELAVGLVRDDSNRPFLRLFVPPPPAAPRSETMAENVFEKAAAKRREEVARKRYEDAHRAWQSEFIVRRDAFTRALEALLARPADAPATDIWSALRRADIFLCEPHGFALPVSSAVVLISDGDDNVSGDTPPRLNSPTQMLVVNGAAGVGDLGPLAPVRFESLDAALRFAVGKEH